ncbi:uncharacterized protein LAESUDRAFT_756839 [Laetiporus sulphureus 93-53]|uniref:Uncharacterized protein n=1 Tax=Laetiporus sulphureus 93-53 TaxID=1314785 RepID=A0A165FMI8_9APHY|nr:uncharacterized protein LAESUDRAFT_756839 [Laetiporus sulphureus 93-53]KZT09195.1 hypothetical protein LAESUDRAFT_756839 [Laetiporus sulphureus 93-53]
MLAKPGFDLLAELVQRLGHKRFLRSLDECTELNHPGLFVGPKPPKGPQQRMSLIALQRIIKVADEFTFPHAGALKPLPVWSYVDFDQKRRDVELKSAEHALLIHFLAMFGRPYWYTLGDSPDVVPAARKKLIYDDEFNPENLDHVFAVFANRFVLQISNTK